MTRRGSRKGIGDEGESGARREANPATNLLLGLLDRPKFVQSSRLRILVKRHGTGRLLERNRTKVAVPSVGRLWTNCHGCQVEVDVGPRMTVEERREFLAFEHGPTVELAAERFWIQLIDGQPWLCRTCELQLP